MDGCGLRDMSAGAEMADGEAWAYPTVYARPTGLPDFSPDSGSDYQKALRARDSWDPLAGGEIAMLSSRCGRVTVGVGSGLVVKYSTHDLHGEYTTLDEVHKACKSGTPRPVAHWKCETPERWAMVMTRLPGEPLDDDAKHFDGRVLRGVSRSLRDIMASARKLKSPTIGGCGVEPARSRFIGCDGLGFNGVNDGLSLLHHMTRLYSGAGDVAVGRVHSEHSAYVASLPGGVETYVMTHGDLHPNNVVVHDEGGTVRVGLVDWEFGSYMPLYWEHLMARLTYTPQQWRLAMCEAVDEYPGVVNAIVDMIAESQGR